MDPVQISIDFLREALWLSTLISAPILLIGLVVGVLISILQAATQIQEQTLSFVPKILAVLLILFMFAPWMINLMTDYTTRTFKSMATFNGYYER